MYDLRDYVAMVEDPRRTRAYLDAMRAVIRPGDVVLELGTGFGYFAVHAAKLGAARVYAIEPSDAIAVGPELAEANGVADRIRFIQQRSERVELAERADVLVEDLRGVSPLHGGRLVALLDARERLLTTGARRVIPARDRLMVAPAPVPVDLASPGARVVAPSPGETIDLGPLEARFPHAWRRTRADQVHPLSQPAVWASIDYATFTSCDLEGEATCAIDRAGTIGGFAAWFDAELSPGIGFSTGPSPERSVYDLGWFPLVTPVDATAGDEFVVRLRAKFDGRDYVWVWETDWRAGDDRRAPVRQRQSNLLQRAISPERLARRAAGHVPRLGAELSLTRDALTLVDGRRSLGAIAALMREREPSRFASSGDALRWLTERLALLDEGGTP